MKQSKYSESQIVFAIKQVETGTRIQEVCRKMGINEATLKMKASLIFVRLKIE